MIYFFKMIAIVTRLEGQKNLVFTCSWLCNANYFLTQLSGKSY